MDIEKTFEELYNTKVEEFKRVIRETLEKQEAQEVRRVREGLEAIGDQGVIEVKEVEKTLAIDNGGKLLLILSSL